MNDIKAILNCLGQSPEILKNLIADIPAARLKERRKPGKMTIHEHACHIIDVQAMMTGRFRTFLNEANPEFVPYFPGESDDKDRLMKMDFHEMPAQFSRRRQEMIDLVKDQPAAYWNKAGRHPEYEVYTPFIFLRHILMHDHVHMYRIEELWLTADAYL